MSQGNPEIVEHSSEGGWARARRRLTLERVEKELGPLATVDHAMLRLDRLGQWITAGMLTGSTGSAAVRSVEGWLKARESKLTWEVVHGLKADVDRLKAELSGRRMRVAQWA